MFNLMYIILILRLISTSFGYIAFLSLSFTNNFNRFFSALVHFLPLICLSYFDQHQSNMLSYIQRIAIGVSHPIQYHDLLYASLTIYDILISHYSYWYLIDFCLWLTMLRLIRHCNIGIHIFCCWAQITQLFEYEKSSYYQQDKSLSMGFFV